MPEAQLNDLGQAVVPGNIVGALVNRLKVVDWVKQHPEVSEERIEAPFVVVGIFRAGTTLLSYLLEKDDRHRPLFGWEAQDSVPPPDPAHMKDDPRIAATVAGRAMLDEINPRIKVVQNEEPDGPTECIGVLNQDFKSLVWEALTNVPTYGAWLHATDHRSAYEYHRHGAPGAPERRGPRPVVAQEPAPRAPPRRPHRRVPRCPHRGDAP